MNEYRYSEYGAISNRLRANEGIRKKMFEGIDSWNLPAQEMSAQRTGLLVFEVEYSKEKAQRTGNSGDKYLWNGKCESPRNALMRYEVLKTAKTRINNGDQVRAYFNGQDISEKLRTIIEHATSPLNNLPNVLSPKTMKKVQRIKDRDSEIKRFSSFLDTHRS